MPYDSVKDLPDSVKGALPEQAQHMYCSAFNSAWDEYGQDEARAHRVAWGAVKKEYHKTSDGKWVKG